MLPGFIIPNSAKLSCFRATTGEDHFRRTAVQQLGNHCSRACSTAERACWPCW